MLSEVGDELDLTRLLDLQRVLDTSLPEIVGKLVTDIERSVDEIEAGMTAGDSHAVAHGAHAARNSALMLDAQPMLDALAEIEAAARAGELRAAGDGIARLHSSWPVVRARLEREMSAT
jgi:HPt (histidine-containing phosphotransfer) domain-containing protein